MRVAAFLALLTIARAADLTTVDGIRNHFYKLERHLWYNVTDPNFIQSGVADIDIAKAFAKFNKEIDSISVPPRPPLKNWLWNRALEKMKTIDENYKTFSDFVKTQAAAYSVPALVKEWNDVAEQILLVPDTSVAQAVEKLHEILQHGDMFRTPLHLQEDPDLCELQLSPHQLIFDMYNTISLTEIKGYAMMQFSWMLLRIYEKGNFTQEASLTRQRYAQRTAQTATAARAAMQMAKRDLYRCDPPEHKEGETYAQVTKLLQGYIENEVDMNTEGACTDNCAAYNLAENHGCFKDQFCARQPACKGRIFDCQYIDSDMWVCLAGRNSVRRYDWIHYENGRTLGKMGSCNRGTTKVDSWWRWNLSHCSYCMCLCEEPANQSERFFSLKDVVTNIDSNKVVTGIRLIKLGRVFHLQISEGKLGERGSVTPGSWVPVQAFDPEDVGVQAMKDYYTLTYEKRAMDLDELDSPAGSILTGVRFRELGGHLHFEIRSTPFNFTTGRLVPDLSKWISNDNTVCIDCEKPRSLLQLYKPDVPTRSLTPLPVDSNHDQFIEFTYTDFEADAAQTTVPFIDIQKVEPLKGAGLVSGAGMIHRGVRGSGGFIAPKLFTYDYSKHVKADPPPQPLDIEGDTTEFVPVVN